MRILGIETSCDETSAAVVANGRRVLSNVVASQVAIHGRYFGVVPELASRAHIEAIHPVMDAALAKAGIGLRTMGRHIDAIAYTRGPGLAGSLLVGQVVAQTLSLITGVPLIDVNHLEGHLYAVFLERGRLRFPYLALIVSGGHTELVVVESFGRYRVLGGTRDDAAGEAFDKVAKLLRLPYPGGPVIDARARKGDGSAIRFPRPYLPGSWDFSFSGLKTSVVNYVRAAEQEGRALPVDDICASFQRAVVDTLVEKTVAAAKYCGIKRIAAGGGVAANSALRKDFLRRGKREGLSVAFPSPALCTDNAAMIACAGYYKFKAANGAPPGPGSQRIEPGLALRNW